MNLALNNLQRLIHQPTNQPTELMSIRLYKLQQLSSLRPNINIVEL